ncbi:MAG: hypothetical protein JW884_01250 [Deltaproteobacteria bacterium]|nr:hypothetical protein [Deltaproteobacteria bacterium]
MTASEAQRLRIMGARKLKSKLQCLALDIDSRDRERIGWESDLKKLGPERGSRRDQRHMSFVLLLIGLFCSYWLDMIIFSPFIEKQIEYGFYGIPGAALFASVLFPLVLIGMDLYANHHIYTARLESEDGLRSRGAYYTWVCCGLALCLTTIFFIILISKAEASVPGGQLSVLKILAYGCLTILHPMLVFSSSTAHDAKTYWFDRGERNSLEHRIQGSHAQEMRLKQDFQSNFEQLYNFLTTIRGMDPNYELGPIDFTTRRVARSIYGYEVLPHSGVQGEITAAEIHPRLEGPEAGSDSAKPPEDGRPSSEERVNDEQSSPGNVGNDDRAAEDSDRGQFPIDERVRTAEREVLP